MRTKALIYVTFLLHVGLCRAQQETVTINNSSFTGNLHRLILSKVDGWYFRPGHDTAWSAKEISMSEWKRMRPSQFGGVSRENGRAEGWFRINIHLSEDLNVVPSGILSPIWAASEVYINGNLVATFGHTGNKDNGYHENMPYWQEPFSFQFKPGATYAIAIHTVDYVAFLSGGALKSSTAFGADFGNLLMLTTPLTPHISTRTSQFVAYYSVLLAITGVISILFWFFWLLNMQVRDHLLFAVCCSLISVCITTTIFDYTGATSFIDVRTRIFFFDVFAAFAQLLIFNILVRVFNYKCPHWLRYSTIAIICMMFVCGEFLNLLPLSNLFGVLYAVICIGVVTKSWKKLRGAQWAVVASLLLAIVFATISGTFGSYSFSIPSWITRVVFAAAVTSFPFGLMVYAAMRLKEINNETREQAARLIQLSEEKKEQALHQQEILQQEVDSQTADLRKTLDNLKATQAQLIQSEKMASLGELTAGIAHEIQNPLNFVNNFSEVSSELVDEMKSELAIGNGQQASAIADDLKQNLEKIMHHGKRADAIVKGMLQHSRSSTGQKEPTDINALADEYLRLAYHGLRAKDKSFNAKFETNLDTSIGKINVVPQDIGRVMLNVINNAFYSVNEKQKQNRAEYEPIVTVKSKKTDGMVELSVIDNGNGIPQKVVDKIFQPFFTTKPTGVGTGLGLSLSYDIVTKGHGGELKVHTVENAGSEFIIRLPV